MISPSPLKFILTKTTTVSRSLGVYKSRWQGSTKFQATPRRMFHGEIPHKIKIWISECSMESWFMIKHNFEFFLETFTTSNTSKWCLCFTIETLWEIQGVHNSTPKKNSNCNIGQPFSPVKSKSPYNRHHEVVPCKQPVRKLWGFLPSILKT